jgi:RNA polymerase sigma factor (sigma-70 family)
MEFLRKVATAGSVAQSTDAELLSRFVAQRDESAFAALVQRHGPMIFGVCRRVLHDTQDAEDAYQATFLVLARRAKSVARPETLGNWLYGVAYRTALRARASASRRRAQERQQVAARTEREPVDELIVQEIRLLLDEEVHRLPAKYRAPFVLCLLEGHTHEEAAQALGCPRKTITTWLTRARERLHGRLMRRGLTLASATFAALQSQKSLTAAGLPLPEVASTVRAALQFATNAAITAGTVSAPVAALARGVLRSMTITKVATMIAVVLALTVLSSSAGLLAFHAFAGGKDEKFVAGPGEAEKAKSVQKETKAKSDNELLQGTWIEESRGADGYKVAEASRWTLVFDRDKVTWHDRGKEREGTYTLDPGRKPKEIDLTMNNPSLVLTGIYELKGDTLKTLWRENDRDGLPKDFDAKEGVLIVLKKKK